jgi:hypothetical protein
MSAGTVLAIAVVAGWCSLASGAAWACAGDCDGDGRVGIEEVMIGVRIALGSAVAQECPPLDRDGSGSVTVDELVQAIRAAQAGCPTPTPTATLPPTPTSTPVNRPPVVPTPWIYRTFPGIEVERGIGAVDPDGDPLRFGSSNLPDGASLGEEDGVFRWVPAADQIGPFHVPYTVTDAGIPPLAAEGELIFQVMQPDGCSVSECDPAAGCATVLRPPAEGCCAAVPLDEHCAAGPATPRVAEAVAPCPEGRVLFIGRNTQSGTFGRMRNCDCQRAVLGLQLGPEVRFNVETRCLGPGGVPVRARLETKDHLLFDEIETFDLAPRDDGYAEVFGARFPVDFSLPPSAIDGVEANLTVTVTDQQGVEASNTLRVVLTFERLPELPDP